VVLGVLRERGRKGLPLTQLYRQMFNRELYLLAFFRTNFLSVFIYLSRNLMDREQGGDHRGLLILDPPQKWVPG